LVLGKKKKKKRSYLNKIKL